MFLIGLTGGIASGKSTVSKIFREDYGIPVVDADVISRQVVEPNKKGWFRIKAVFGDGVFNGDGTLNRDKLGEIIFKNDQMRRKLNKCLHDLIIIEMLKQIFWLFIKGNRYIILDIPLLFETKFALSLLSYKVVVFCDEEIQLKRLMERNNLSEEDAKIRMQAQMKTKDKLKLADFTIDNSNKFDETKQQVERLFKVFDKSKKYIKIRICIGIALSILLSGIIFTGNFVYKKLF